MKLALFKVFKGEASALSSQAMVDGYCWFTYTDGKFYIDYADPSDDSVHRQVLNAGFADSAGSATYDSDGAEIAANTYFVDIDLASNSIQFLNQSNQAIASIAAGDNITLSAAAGGGISIAATDTTYTFNTTAQSNKIQYKETGANSWTDIPINVSITETDPTVPAWAKESTKPTYTASEVGAAESSHTHGNITNGGDITATAPTIANGDQLVINDDSAGKITNGPTFDGTTTSKYLSKKGTWEDAPTAASIGALTSESDPIFSASAASGISSSDISNWNGKQNALPSQTNNSGKFLTTNGSALSWAADNDTKNTAGSGQSTSKIFLIGAKTQGNNPITYSNSNLYYSYGLYSKARTNDSTSILSQTSQSISFYIDDDESNTIQELLVSSKADENVHLLNCHKGITINNDGETTITGLITPTSDDMAANKKYVDDAISGLPNAMQFKGTVGTSGTVAWANLPSAASSNVGFTYKVITKHTSAPICDVGDTIISDGSSWVVIPSGDEPSGTVTSVGVSSPLTTDVNSGDPITSSGTISLTAAYGDTQNPYGTKDANKVLAGPSSGSAAAPSFRALVANDIPNTVKIGSASFADDTSSNSSKPVKLTIKDSQTTASNLVTANIPKVSSTSAGVVPKGASVSTQSQTTKFLREDGTWAAPTYTDASGKIDTAGTGLSKSGTTLNHSNSVTAQTTSGIYPVKIDAQGHISEYGTALGNVSTTADGLLPSFSSTNKSSTNLSSSNYIWDATQGKYAKLPSTAFSDTNTASAVDNILHGSNSGTAITYAPYTAQQSDKLSFDTSTTNPTRTDRLNLNGYMYATKYNVAGSVALEYNATTQALNFVFT